jgi:hypothetical protein
MLLALAHVFLISSAGGFCDPPPQSAPVVTSANAIAHSFYRGDGQECPTTPQIDASIALNKDSPFPWTGGVCVGGSKAKSEPTVGEQYSLVYQPIVPGFKQQLIAYTTDWSLNDSIANWTLATVTNGATPLVTIELRKNANQPSMLVISAQGQTFIEPLTSKLDMRFEHISRPERGDSVLRVTVKGSLPTSTGSVFTFSLDGTEKLALRHGNIILPAVNQIPDGAVRYFYCSNPAPL